MILAVPGASFAAYYAHLVEVPGWYYEFRSWRGTEGLLMLIGVAGGLVAADLGAVFRMLALLGVAAFVSVPFVKPFLGPFPDGALRDLWSGDVCLQSTYSTCGAAAAASLLRKHGLAATEAEIAKEAYSYQGGTEVWYLARAVRRRGLKATMHVSDGMPDFLHDMSRPFTPCIVGVKFGGTGHFIALLSRDGDQFHVGDPLRGSEKVDGNALRDRYRYSGFWMEVGP
ncbi:cysteine peptidase family C39 domain-containing protein [Prosthecobacter sp. SYSU 5D2]|uniref:cysteine peptidase family C39 domain-containing protein n=1 Tax=Prosthecobacter sp. SYSU 5D2 TaxID=3134134 RepID=UPI0031FE7D94